MPATPPTAGRSRPERKGNIMDIKNAFNVQAVKADIIADGHGSKELELNGKRKLTKDAIPAVVQNINLLDQADSRVNNLFADLAESGMSGALISPHVGEIDGVKSLHDKKAKTWETLVFCSRIALFNSDTFFGGKYKVYAPLFEYIATFPVKGNKLYSQFAEDGKSLSDNADPKFKELYGNGELGGYKSTKKIWDAGKKQTSSKLHKLQTKLLKLDPKAIAYREANPVVKGKDDSLPKSDKAKLEDMVSELSATVLALKDAEAKLPENEQNTAPVDFEAIIKAIKEVEKLLKKVNS